MATVEVILPHLAYQVTISPGLLADLGSITRAVAPHGRCALLGDEQVMGIYGRAAADSLTHAGYRVTSATMPAGEEHKTLENVRRFYEALGADRLERGSPVVALGGGVTGDTVGFAAASYLRGLPLVQCPTSLLAMVDASVGGKVGVNLPQGKNLVGAFHQPVAVVVDPLVLQTLPPRELQCGLSECVKHALIRDADLFEFIHTKVVQIQALNPAVMTDLIGRNVSIKAAVVALDERESGVRAHLNFGHTFGHAIEAVTGYKQFHHGEAVSLGMVAATALAADLGLCDSQVLEKLRGLLGRLGLPTSAILPPESQLTQAMALDKKVKDAKIRLILPTRIGEVVIRDDVPSDRIAAAWKAIRAKG